jgi:hypothetical protein
MIVRKTARKAGVGKRDAERLESFFLNLLKKFCDRIVAAENDNLFTGLLVQAGETGWVFASCYFQHIS